MQEVLHQCHVDTALMLLLEIMNQVKTGYHIIKIINLEIKDG